MKKWILAIALVAFVASPAFIGGDAPAEDSEPAATPTPEPTPTMSVEEELDRERRQNEQAIMERINQLRTEAGVGALSMDADQREIARRHSDDMVEDHYYNHTAPDGTSFMPACRPSGEILMKADASLYDHKRVAEIVAEAWMDSPSHKEILLDSRYSKMGVGVRMLWGGPQYVTVNFC